MFLHYIQSGVSVFPILELHSHRFNKQLHQDPETGETVGAVEEWEKESWDNRKAMNDAYDQIHEEHTKSGQQTPWSNPTDIDWKKHFEEYKGKGFMSCLDQFLEDPEEEDVA